MTVNTPIKRTHPMSSLITKAELDKQRLTSWLEEVGKVEEEEEIARLRVVVERQKEEISRLRDEIKRLNTIKYST